VMNLSHGRRRLAAIGLTAALTCGALAGTAVASASTASARASASAAPNFKSPTECDGDVCMVLVVNGDPLGAQIVAGANSNGFTGYFHISGPGGPFSPANSPTENWPAHGMGSGNHDWPSLRLPAEHGTYCASAFRSSDGANLGKACATY